MDNNTVELLKWGVILFILYRILNKFGLVGSTADEKNAENLMSNVMMTGNQTAAPVQLVKAVSADLNKPQNKITADDIKKYSPSSSIMLKWLQDIKDADGYFNDNENLVYSVFRSMKNQVALYTFSQFFKVYENVDLIDYLKSFLDESELSTVYKIINALPKV